MFVVDGSLVSRFATHTLSALLEVHHLTTFIMYPPPVSHLQFQVCRLGNHPAKYGFKKRCIGMNMSLNRNPDISSVSRVTLKFRRKLLLSKLCDIEVRTTAGIDDTVLRIHFQARSLEGGSQSPRNCTCVVTMVTLV